mmetsp:Transcript_97158/g.177712  ORF Transcript_97158/g.177712 Transcript_97158/m.177712 type:complete len:201 (+) Transcript_97158:2347-2949(+)
MSPFLADCMQPLIEYPLHFNLRLKSAVVGLNLQNRLMHARHSLPSEEPTNVSLNRSRLLHSVLLRMPVSHTSCQCLDLGCRFGLFLHLSSAFVPTSPEPLAVDDGLGQLPNVAATKNPSVSGLEISQAPDFPSVPFTRLAPVEHRLHVSNLSLKFVSVQPGLVLAVPAFQNPCIPSIVAINLLTIPHLLALLKYKHGFRL